MKIIKRTILNNYARNFRRKIKNHWDYKIEELVLEQMYKKKRITFNETNGNCKLLDCNKTIDLTVEQGPFSLFRSNSFEAKGIYTLLVKNSKLSVPYLIMCFGKGKEVLLLFKNNGTIGIFERSSKTLTKLSNIPDLFLIEVQFKKDIVVEKINGIKVFECKNNNYSKFHFQFMNISTEIEKVSPLKICYIDHYYNEDM